MVTGLSHGAASKEEEMEARRGGGGGEVSVKQSRSSFLSCFLCTDFRNFMLLKISTEKLK